MATVTAQEVYKYATNLKTSHLTVHGCFADLDQVVLQVHLTVKFPGKTETDVSMYWKMHDQAAKTIQALDDDNYVPGEGRKAPRNPDYSEYGELIKITGLLGYSWQVCSRPEHADTFDKMVASYQNYFPDLDTDHMTDGPLRPFIPSDFPVGTKFICGDLNRGSPNWTNDDGTPRVFTAASVGRNSPTNFLIHTKDKYKDEAAYGRSSFMGMSMDHVTKIVEHPKRRYMAYSRMEDNSNYRGMGSVISHDAGTPFVNNLVEKYTRLEQVIDGSAFRTALYEQSFWRSRGERKSFETTNEAGEPAVHVYGRVASRKKVERWIKRNINRFLTNPKKAQEEYDRSMTRAYESDFDGDVMNFMIESPSRDTNIDILLPELSLD